MANDYNNTDWTEDANTKASASSNIEGATQLNNTLTIGVNDTGYDVKFFGDTSTNGYMLWDASTDDLILGSSSKIGIGEPSPDALLHIRETTDDTAAYLRIETANNGNGDIGVLFQEITSIKAAVGYDAGRDAVALVHASGLDSSNGINILSSGNVGIGTKTPDALLHLESSTDTALIIRADSDNSGENDNPLIHLQQDYRAAGASGVLADTKIGMIGDAEQIYTSSIANASYITAQGSISTGDSDTGTIQFATGGNNGQDTDVTARLATARMTIAASGKVGIGTAAPATLLEILGGTGTGFSGSGTLRLSNADASIVDNDVLGSLQFASKSDGGGDDALLPGAAIWAEAEGTYTAAGNETALVFATATTSTALATANERMRIDKNGKVGIGLTSPTAQLHIDQSSTSGAIPVLTLDQADVSEEMMEFLCVIGTGNAIEAVASKSLTTTHFIKVTIQGGLTRYFPVGTIA
jgi:hypothetical protein